MSDDTTRIITRKSILSTEADKTSLVGGKSTSSEDDSTTRIFRPGSKKNAIDEPTSSQDAGYISDPVVGWLVVVSGPGKGSSHTLGYGMNSIGRSPEDRVSINYGDTQISRRAHAQLTYDPRSRGFYIHHGGGTNLTYLGNAPVLQPTSLQGGESIGLGETVLKFVRLCGPDFEWQDN
jgi:hypothetical protein